MQKDGQLNKKQAFANALTKQAAEHLNVKEEWVTVLFDEYDRENWASGGTLHSIKFGEGFGKGDRVIQKNALRTRLEHSFIH